jgi:long-chain fatty acid transport protein
MKLRALVGALALAGVMAPAFATNGYFSHGYGMKAKGMAGVGIAFGQDSLAAATNPANMVSVGDRLDVGIDYFSPQREAKYVPSGVTYNGNDKDDFFVPEFGYNKMLSSTMSLGVSVYGNGGMNTDYGTNPPSGLGGTFGTGNLGVDLSQLFIAPTLSMKLNQDHSVGVALNLAYQRFKAYGLHNFQGFTPSNTTNNLTNLGYDDSYGMGVRFGWTGKLSPTVTVGATYQSRTYMSKFDKYKELFAEGGDFDIPATYGLGIAVQATPALTIAADVQQIDYSSVKSIANRLDFTCTPGTGNGTCKLGQENGPGFGWRDMTVYKLGVSYQYSPSVTLRAGYSTGRQPIPGNQTLFNVIAPAVVQDHVTLGGTWTLANKAEVTVAYMHALKHTVTAGTGAGGEGPYDLTMYQNSLGVAYGVKY